MQIKTFSYRFAEEILNSQLTIKREILDSVSSLDLSGRKSSAQCNSTLEVAFSNLGWQPQPLVLGNPGDPTSKMDFVKDRIGVEIQFGHLSFLGIDLLKFQIASYSGNNTIDVGVYITGTAAFRKANQWDYRLSYEKVLKYLPHFKSAIQVPVFLIGIDV